MASPRCAWRHGVWDAGRGDGLHRAGAQQQAGNPQRAYLVGGSARARFGMLATRGTVGRTVPDEEATTPVSASASRVPAYRMQIVRRPLRLATRATAEPSTSPARLAALCLTRFCPANKKAATDFLLGRSLVLAEWWPHPYVTRSRNAPHARRAHASHPRRSST